MMPAASAAPPLTLTSWRVIGAPLSFGVPNEYRSSVSEFVDTLGVNPWNGGPAGVTLDDAGLQSPCPIWFDARNRNVSAVPLVRPVKVSDVAPGAAERERAVPTASIV